MSPVIYTPPPLCQCQPPMRKVGSGLSEVPAYRVDTIWACDNCGKRWIVASKTYMDPTIEDHRAGLFVTSTWWQRHDKDTP